MNCHISKAPSKEMLNLLFSRFQAYRRWRGGIWWLINPPVMGVDAHWVNRCPAEDENCLDTEDYTGYLVRTLPDGEFFRMIANIPINGAWKDDLNLSKYLSIARTFRQRGIEDNLIIDYLTELYSAASREQTTGLSPKYYDQEEIQDLVNAGKRG